MEIPMICNGKDYSKTVDNAIQQARTEYLYPSTATGHGMKKIFGRKYYADLIAANICNSRIPNQLKIELIGKEKFEGCIRNR